MNTRRVTGNLRGDTDSRLVSLASDLSAPNLGLDRAVYDEIASSVTMVLHVRLLSRPRRSCVVLGLTTASLVHSQNAWQVNFLLATPSFEPHIKGVHNLMTLAVSNPSQSAHLYFASSVSAVFAWPGPGDVPEAVTDDPAVAQNMGYARCVSP